MEHRRYLIRDFLAADETYHIARKTILPTDTTQSHVHDFYELFLVESGTALHAVNGQSRVVEQGSLVFVRPEDDHVLRVQPSCSAVVVNVMFRQESANHLISRYGGELSGRYFWANGDMPATYQLTESRQARLMDGLNDLHTGTRSLARIEAFLLTATRILDLPPMTASTVPPWLLTAIEMAREPDVFRNGAAGFVQAAGRGHEHVCRKTREHLGVTPSALINQIRMEHAAHLLVDQDQSVNDVAEKVGIDNMSHFYRVFRQHYGVTPKVYRRQHQKSPF